MSEETTVRFPSTTIVSKRVLGPRGAQGEGVDIVPGMAVLGPPPFNHRTQFRGAVSGGPPATGTNVAGDWCIDVADGCEWLCMVSGTPGTWTRMGSAGVETLFIEAAVNQTGLTTATNVTGLASFAPTVIGTRPQELLVFPTKMQPTAGTPPVGGGYTLYEVSGGVSTVVAGSLVSPMSVIGGGLGQANAAPMMIRRTAAQLVGKTYRLEFLPLGTGATFTLPAATAIPHRVIMKEV